MGTPNKILKFSYLFEYADGRRKNYDVHLDQTTTSFTNPPSPPFDDWTRLEYNQCTNCPLKKETTPHCPIATNLQHLAKFFQDDKSFLTTKVTIQSPERMYVKEVPLQIGLGSLFGLIMATSDCPIMSFLRPTAHFHLPFASSEETMVRLTSMYLLSQYFAFKRGIQPDINLKSLDEMLHNVKLVNQGMVNRIKGLHTKSGDADNNAIVILDSLAMLLSSQIKSELNSLEYLFTKKAA